MKVLTITFRFLGSEVSIKSEGDAVMADVLDSRLIKHYNQDAIIVPRNESDTLYKKYLKMCNFTYTRSRSKMLCFIIND
jgi:hypothetical protein